MECDVALKKSFKQRSWGHAFVTVFRSDAPGFREKVDGLKFQDCPVSVSDSLWPKGGGKRKAGGDATHEDAKRPKVAGPEGGRVPLLKELRDRAKQHKRSSEGASIVQKAEPLVEYPYETQLAMKNTFVKTSVRTFTKLAAKRCEEVGRDPAVWLGRDWSLALKAPSGCCCPVEPPVGAPPESIAGWRNKCEFTIRAGPRQTR
ncbi:unnamed protein product [Prorocentrum cordatum]|uniref:Uncharacterized protein n=1 Tax=Prorocentrum cordatum TaxID=2364126 RepID=A0ABN9Y160_9DINO|nr:unnamed protein product [Polarella glacialis]